MDILFKTVCSDYKIDAAIITKWISNLKMKYSEPHRFYHNDTNMFSKKLDFLKSSSKYVIFATIFQYYEFDSKKNCVEQNCNAFIQFYTEAGMNDENLKKIVLKLLGDETIEEIDGFVEEWEYFQDIDLIILGSSDDEYKEYTELLRKEYNTMDLENYHSMRSKEDSLPIAETITSTLSNMSSKNQDDDDCVIVDVTPASIICLDDDDSELNLIDNKSNSENSNTITHNERDIQSSLLENISSLGVGDNVFTNNLNDTNLLFMIDSNPGYNGSKIPLYHSINSCAHSTPLRTDNTGTDIGTTLIQNTDAPQLSRKQRCDSDVIILQDDSESVISFSTHDSKMDESVIFCGVQTERSPIRRFETTTPSPNGNKKRLSPVKRSRLQQTKNSNTSKEDQSKNNDLHSSFKSLGASNKRIVIIDGCNVAFGHGINKIFSAEGIEIALRYFERKGHETKIVVPQSRLRFKQSTNQTLMLRLQETDKLVVTPSKNLPGKMSSSYDDRFILQLADEFNAAIISNDNYRDLMQENPSWKKIIETRVIGYTWLKNFFMVPTDPYGKSGPKLDDILNKKV